MAKEMSVRGIALIMMALLVSGNCFIEAENKTGMDKSAILSQNEICFAKEVLPIFRKHCSTTGCHDPETRSGGYVLNSYNNITERGISKGKPDKSIIYKVLQPGADKPMPKAPLPALNAGQVEKIKNWIEKGAVNSSCSTGK